jgi:hypothetical protein
VYCRGDKAGVGCHKLHEGTENDQTRSPLRTSMNHVTQDKDIWRGGKR